MKHIFFSSAILLMLFINGTFSYSQITDSLYQLPEVSIKEAHIHDFYSGSFKTIIPTEVIEQRKAFNLGELLSINSTLYYDSYGVGSSSLSSRGTGSKRTPVIWNGFNLQSILGGEVDLSLIPVAFVDRIYIENGSNSAQYGNGAAGGVVYIDNLMKHDDNKHTELLLGKGSFDRLTGAASIAIQQQKYQSVIRICSQKSRNDFPYKGTYQANASSPVIRVDTTQNNAQKQDLNLMWNNLIQLTSNQKLSFHLWLQDSERHIAPTIKDVAKSNKATAYQNDQSIRGTADYNVKTKKWDILLRSGYFQNDIEYNNSTSNQLTKSNGKSWIFESDATYNITDFLRMNIGASYNYEKGESSSYSAISDRNRYSLFGSANCRIPKINTQISVNSRFETNEGYDHPLVYSVGLNQPVAGGLSLKAKTGKSYRIPTFNDLYWSSATAVGNPELKAENGWDSEGGFNWHLQTNKVSVNLDASAFYMEMKNWMNWSKREDDIYTVMNIDSARIKGIESKLDFCIGTQEKNIGLMCNYCYLESKDVKNKSYLTYTPKDKLSGRLYAKLNNTSAEISLTYNNSVFVNSSNTIQLPEYTVINMGLHKEIQAKTMDLTIGLFVNNLTNKNYQTHQYYPMPGRNYLVNIDIKI